MEQAGLLQAIFKLNVGPYWELMTGYNTQHLQGLRQLLGVFNEAGAEYGFCLCTTGSNGKSEYFSQSKTEVVIIRERSGLDFSTALLVRLQEARNLHLEPGPNGQPCTYDLFSDLPLSFVDHNPERVYPDFLLNSVLLSGPDHIHLNARQRVLGELSAETPEGSRIREHVRQQLKDYRTCLKRGEYRGVTVVDPAGIQYYTESQPLALGVKMGYLRTVQRKLDLMTLQLLRSGISSAELAASLPTGTAERISFMQQQGLVDQQLSLKVTAAYKWALMRYHEAQAAYKMQRTPVAVPVDQVELELHRSAVLAFSYLQN
jgi:hypothetical protein